MIRRAFQPQFEPPILDGTKIHTIRPTPKRLPQIGEEFVGFVWTGKPYRSPQREFFQSKVSFAHPLSIDARGFVWENFNLINRWSDEFACRDGFANYTQMLEWFRTHHGLPFEGIIIYWKIPIRPLTPDSCLLSSDSRLLSPSPHA
jgi:hypothetical protein